MDDKFLLVQDYLNDNGVLIVDKNLGSRNRLLKVLMDLGVKRHMVHIASNMHEARDIISHHKFGLILSEYLIVGGSGFDLFKMVREKFKENKFLCQILVTSNISQSAVAKAAEEDVDSVRNPQLN